MRLDRNMDSALLKFVGLSLAHLGLLRRGQRVMLLPVNGADVVALCLKVQPEATVSVITRATSELWAKLEASAVPRHSLEAHIAWVSDLVTSTGGCGRGRPGSGVRSDDAATDARAIAQAIVAGANLPPAAAVSGNLNVQKTLELLFEALLACGPEFDACLDAAAGAADQIIADASATAEANKSALLAVLRRQLATDTGISDALLGAIVAAQARLANPIKDILQSLTDRTVTALDLLSDLTHLSDRVGSDDELEAELRHIASLVREGCLGAAGCALDLLSRRIEGASDFEKRVVVDLTGMAFFPTLLATRARLANLGGELREAARLFGRAAYFWPREDRIKRWQMKIAQARQLAELGRLPGAGISVSSEAAQVYAAAGGLVSEEDCPLGWAEAHVELGALLLSLGQREDRPGRYLAAALHFKPAIDVFTRERAMDGWARAQIGLADALRRQAAHQGDVVIAREAAFAYRAALGILTEGGTPELWHHARCALGDCLVLIAEESGDVDCLQLAIDHLLPFMDSATAAIGEPAHSIGDIATGRAMLFLVESGSEPLTAADTTDADDAVALGEAIEFIRGALARGQTHLTSLERAQAERALGRAQSLSYRLTGDQVMLADAIASKMRAVDLYEYLGDVTSAEDIDTEISALENFEDPLAKGGLWDRAGAWDRARGDAALAHEPASLHIAGALQP